MGRTSNIRLLILPSWYPPRGGYFFREHSLALAAEGLDVTVMATIQTSMRKHGLINYIIGKDIPRTNTDITNIPGSFSEVFRPYRTIPFLNKANAFGWIRNAITMTETWIRKNGTPDLIQAHSSIWAGVAAARIKNRHGIPYVLTEHRSRFVNNTTEAQKMFLPWHDPLLQEAFANASRIVTVSRSLQNKILSITGKDIQQGISAIPNMVDTKFFNPSLKPIPDKPFTFFCLAHLEPVKGIDTLIDAMKLLTHDKMTPCHLFIGGHGSQRQALEEQTARLGLQQRITFCGALSRDEVKQHLHHAHAFVLPSRFEAFGVVFIEAMACGLPVIAARSGGPESFISDDYGIIVDPNQPSQLAEAMRHMTQHYNGYDRNAIWTNTINKYSPKAIATKYVRLYHQILHSSSPEVIPETSQIRIRK